MKRLAALNESIAAFKADLPEGPRSAIGELVLAARREGYPFLTSSQEKQCGVYIYSDRCDPENAFNSRPTGTHTTIRYIGYTEDTFKNRISDHKGNSKWYYQKLWTWYEIIPIERHYAVWARPLEQFLSKTFKGTGENKSFTKQVRNSVDFYGRESFTVWDEATNSPSALHKLYFA